jgi:replicative DNA helicase
MNAVIHNAFDISVFSNLEAEQALLGAILSNNAALLHCDLEPDHFAEPVHARIFEACAGLIREGRLASAVTLKNYFESDATLKEIGGTAYLGRLAASATTIINAEEYAKTIRDMSVRRRTAAITALCSEELINLDFDQTGSQYAADLVMRLTALMTEGETRKTRFTMKEAVKLS